MNNPFDYTPDPACDEAFRKLVARLEALKLSARPGDADFCRELEEGKMLGVMIAADDCGVRHTLYAFSGQVGDAGFNFPGFVGAVFDYLEPGGLFKTEEAAISRMNGEITRFETGPLAAAVTEYGRMKEMLDAEVTECKERFRQSKLERRERRLNGNPDEAEQAAMIRQSQYEKAELHRLKKSVAARLEPIVARLKKAESHLDALRLERKARSEALQQWLFNNFMLLNARGESRSLSDIFAETNMKIPPSGAGECCAPKLLQATYLRGWQPVAIAEYWYGRPKEGELRRHGEHYHACRGKCLPVLGWMLQGLTVVPPLNGEREPVVSHEPQVLYENRWFCVVNKPAGMLSVPGKGVAISVQHWLAERYGAERDVRMAHRLDRDTSGLLVAAFGPQSLKVMQSLFARREVRKTYVAELEGDYRSVPLPIQGRIELPLSPDWLDRPRQRIDYETGKEAVTEYGFRGVAAGRSRIIFRPLTGRTHQLRVHAAAESGLGMPIVGDPLYGKNAGRDAERLHLHAHKLEFTFPLDGRRYSFEAPIPF